MCTKTHTQPRSAAKLTVTVYRLTASSASSSARCSATTLTRRSWTARLSCASCTRRLPDTGETQRAILGYVQKLVTDSTHAAGLLGRTPPILKALCDIGLLTKDAVLEWHADGGGQSEPTGAAGKVREAAEPFVDRLRASQQRAAAAESCVDELERALEDAMRAAELERERAAARARSAGDEAKPTTGASTQHWVEFLSCKGPPPQGPAWRQSDWSPSFSSSAEHSLLFE